MFDICTYYVFTLYGKYKDTYTYYEEKSTLYKKNK